MVKRKEGEKICFVCSKIVNTNKARDHYVLLGTYNRSINKDEECFFHFECWTEWFMNKVNNRAKMQVSQMRDKVMQLVRSPMIQSVLSEVKGMDGLMGMVQTPLPITDLRKVKQVKTKIQNGRKKRSAGKRKK